MSGAIFIDNFSSGLDELPRKQQGSAEAVLRVLHQRKRFSVFEVTANDIIARTVTRVIKQRYVRELGGAFPWTNVELTEAGLALIGATAGQHQAT